MVGHTNDLNEPGDYFTADILDQKILVCLGKDREIRGFYNVCMHRGHVLAEGEGCNSIFTCPFHAWSMI
jgi:phenylpropionate dioxygenase-like ring-hydroxylating dioxygenase large terminal subunit